MADHYGYIKVPRRLREAALFTDLSLAGLFLFCMLCASGSDYKDYHAGEFYVSQTQMAQRLHMNRTTLAARLRELERLGFLQVSSSNKGTRIRVCGWEVMQNGEVPAGIQIGQPLPKMRVGAATDIKQPLPKMRVDPCTSFCATADTEIQQPLPKMDTTNNNNKKDKEDKEDKRLIDSENTRSFFSPQFLKLWEAYPKHRRTRKEDAARLYAQALRQGATDSRILSALESNLYCSDWTKENGKYVPGICKWLERAEWRATMDDPEEGGDGGKWASF